MKDFNDKTFSREPYQQVPIIRLKIHIIIIGNTTTGKETKCDHNYNIINTPW